MLLFGACCIADNTQQLEQQHPASHQPTAPEPLHFYKQCPRVSLCMQGVDALAGRSKPGNLARPRRFELAAAVNRLRTAQLLQQA